MAPSGVRLPLSPSVALAVGHNPNSVSSVSGIDGASWNNDRPAFVAFGLQVRKATVEFHADDSRHILANDPSGPDIRNNLEHRRPEETVIARACSLPGE
jgi:hypothetical protein